MTRNPAKKQPAARNEWSRNVLRAGLRRLGSGGVALGLLLALLPVSRAAQAELPLFGLSFEDGGFVETGAGADDLGVGGNAPKTVEAWARPRSFDGTGTIFSLGASGSAGGEFSLRVRNSDNQWRAEFSGAAHDIDFEYPSRDRWVHFAIVHTGGKTLIYANGQRVAEREQELATSPAEPFRIGRGTSPDEAFDGTIQEVRIWNVARSQKELSAGMSRMLTGDEAGLAGYWPLSEGEGRVAGDPASGNPGQFVGDPRWVRARPFLKDLAADKTFVPGENVTFGPVELRDPVGRVTYQWYFNEEPIRRGGQNTLSLSGAGEDDAGTYHVAVNDERGLPPAESRRVRLTPPLPDGKYLFFHIAQTHHLGWQQGDPDSFTRYLFDDFLARLEPVENSTLKAGFSYTFSVLRHSPDTLVESLEALLALSEETGVPVQINVDGQNWWGGRPDLWNWWDPGAPGYDPDNRYNVEWTDWSPDSAIKIAWRNWGSQLRVLPEPNLMSPDFLEATLEGVRPLAATAASWWEGLPDDKKHLFGGFRVGWETSIGVNAYHYPDGNSYLNQDPANDPTYGRDHSQGLFAGLQPIGYAALTTAGIKTSGEITREDVAEVVRRHLAALSEAASEEGIPKHLLFTHQGGTYSPWEEHLPFRPAINEWSTPGWSFYGVDPRWPPELDQAMQDTGRESWAAVEWWWSGGQNGDLWRDHFERTLGWRDCRFLTVYNWNPHLRDTPEGLAAREAVDQMMAERVVVPPERPAFVSYPSTSSMGRYKVRWMPADGAAAYRLERRRNGRNPWEPIHTGDTASYADSVPEGDYYYRVRAEHGGGPSDWSTGLHTTSVRFSPLEDWRREYFAEPGDEGEAGPLADPNGDGITNLLKFALRGDPHANDRSAILPAFRPGAPGGSAFVFRVRGEGAFSGEGGYTAGGAIYRVETADDPGATAWSPFALTPENTAFEDGENGPALLVTSDTGPQPPRKFFRLRVSAPD